MLRLVSQWKWSEPAAAQAAATAITTASLLVKVKVSESESGIRIRRRNANIDFCAVRCGNAYLKCQEQLLYETQRETRHDLNCSEVRLFFSIIRS